MTDTSVEQPIRIAILGTGWGLKVQVPQFKAVGLTVHAMYSRDAYRAADIAKMNGIAVAYSSVEALCKDANVDVVSVVTPPYLHAYHLKAALEAGKHVVCEKPLALNAEEGERMLADCRAHPEQVVIIDHELRFVPSVLQAREHIRRGTLGAVLILELTTIFPEKSPRIFHWFSDAALGGGTLGGIGSHAIDLFRFILDAEVDSVAAHLQTITRHLPDNTGQQREVTADDYASVQLKLTQRPGPAPDSSQRATTAPAWRNGLVSAHFTAAVVGAAQPEGTLRVTGSQGALTLGIENGRLKVTVDGEVVDTREPDKESGFVVGGTRAIGRALQAALGPRHDAAPLRNAARLEDALAAQYVMDAARESSAHGSEWRKCKHVSK